MERQQPGDGEREDKRIKGQDRRAERHGNEEERKEPARRLVRPKCDADQSSGAGQKEEALISLRLSTSFQVVGRSRSKCLIYRLIHRPGRF